MKRGYLADGVLVAPVAPADNVLRVDVDTYTYMASLLGGDYCYLVMGGTEIVKVLGTQVPNMMLVARGLLGTKRLAAETASVRYALTQAEILDSVAFIGYALQETGALTISSTIKYPSVNVLALGGVSVDTGQYGLTWNIQDIPVGRCVGSTPTSIPLAYEKLRIASSGYRITDDGGYRHYA